MSTFTTKDPPPMEPCTQGVRAQGDVVPPEMSYNPKKTALHYTYHYRPTAVSFGEMEEREIGNSNGRIAIN